ncbi:MAG TPA: anti-sigma factor antagonist [Gammaproteobacteria bacterium]|nr:anti-sigma factor antagonist [Gammaproteobacteria bacterium]
MSSISSNISSDGNQGTIVVSGRFDFSIHKEFRDTYQSTRGTGMRFEIDLSSVDYMDSSALGMLLLLREHAGGDKADVLLRNPSSTVERILRIANFGKLFEISGVHVEAASAEA